VCCDCLQFRSSLGRLRDVAALAVVDGALTAQLVWTRTATRRDASWMACVAPHTNWKTKSSGMSKTRLTSPHEQYQ
jgi:hypothetical protein